jgi:iron complex transport system permease protein
MAGIATADEREAVGDGRFVALVALLLVVALASVVVTIGVGAVDIAPQTVIAIIREALAPVGGEPTWTSGQQHIVMDLRIPRTILGATAGAGLAVIGLVLQAITRNPLADPYLFGVSSGAAVGAVIVILYTGSVFGLLTLPLAAFAGALAAIILVFLLALAPGGASIERLVLTGVAVHFLLMAIVNFLIFNASDRGAEAALFWMLGSFGNARWNLLLPPIIALVIGCGWVLYRARSLDALSIGDEAAHTLGISVQALRLEMFVVTALMTGVFVSASGAVGFIGLVVPHCARWIVGARIRRCVPVAIGIGAIFAVWVDAGARYLLAPKELPLGVMTAAVGGLFLIIALKRKVRPA